METTDQTAPVASIELRAQFQLLPPPMATGGLGHREPSSENAYHAVPQSPLVPDPVERPESPTGSLELDPEDEGNELEEIVIAMDASPAISWVHFVFGCAALLPWNGTPSQSRQSAATAAA